MTTPTASAVAVFDTVAVASNGAPGVSDVMVVDASIVSDGGGITTFVAIVAMSLAVREPEGLIVADPFTVVAVEGTVPEMLMKSTGVKGLNIRDWVEQVALPSTKALQVHPVAEAVGFLSVVLIATVTGTVTGSVPTLRTWKPNVVG